MNKKNWCNSELYQHLNACPLRQDKLKVKEKPVERIQPQLPWQCPLIFLINVGKAMENVLFWCYTA